MRTIKLKSIWNNNCTTTQEADTEQTNNKMYNSKYSENIDIQLMKLLGDLNSLLKQKLGFVMLVADGSRGKGLLLRKLICLFGRCMQN